MIRIAKIHYSNPVRVFGDGSQSGRDLLDVVGNTRLLFSDLEYTENLVYEAILDENGDIDPRDVDYIMGTE